MNTPYRVGLLGFGMIGKVHAFGYATMPYYTPHLGRFGQIVSVATAHDDSARQAAALIGCDHYTTRWQEIVEDPEIDIIHICTPNPDHLDQVLAAIENKKHIYCDKPLTVNADSALQIRQALAQTDTNGRLCYTRTNQMTFHLRFFTAIQRAKQLIDEGRLGRIFQYRIGYYHSSSAKESGPFKWKHGAGGGVILDLVSHLADLTDHLLGLPNRICADSVIAWPQRTTPDGQYQNVEVEDSVCIMTRHVLSNQPDITGLIEATKLAVGYEDDMRIEIHGEKGAIRFSLMNSHYLEFFDATASDQPQGGISGWLNIACGARYQEPDGSFPSPKSPTGWVRAHVAALSHFLQAVNANQPTQPNLLQGIRIQNFLQSVAASCREKKWLDC